MYPCVCCGYLTLTEAPGSYLICPICFWEDDSVQLRSPDFAGGANGASLIEAQAAYALVGASEARVVPFVRAADSDDARESGWRPIDPMLDDFTREGSRPWPTDLTVLYWWRPTSRVGRTATP